MGQFSVEILRPPGSLLGGNQHYLIEMAYVEVSDILRGERPRNVAQAQREVMEGRKVA